MSLKKCETLADFLRPLASLSLVGDSPIRAGRTHSTTGCIPPGQAAVVIKTREIIVAIRYQVKDHVYAIKISGLNDRPITPEDLPIPLLQTRTMHRKPPNHIGSARYAPFTPARTARC